MTESVQWGLFAAGVAVFLWRIIVGWDTWGDLAIVAAALFAVGVAGRLDRGAGPAAGYGLLAALLLTPAYAVSRSRTPKRHREPAPSEPDPRTARTARARAIALVVIGVAWVAALVVRFVVSPSGATDVVSWALLGVLAAATSAVYLVSRERH